MRDDDVEAFIAKEGPGLDSVLSPYSDEKKRTCAYQEQPNRDDMIVVSVTGLNLTLD